MSASRGASMTSYSTGARPFNSLSSTTSHPATSTMTFAPCHGLSMDKLEAFEILEKTILTASRDDVPNLVGDLARLQAIAYARLATNGTHERGQPEPEDKLL